MEELDSFSVYCLGDLLPKPHLECWKKFVLACRLLCKYSITSDDITIIDQLLRFCKQSVEIYGEESITPNMHCIATYHHVLENLDLFIVLGFSHSRGIMGF